MVAKFNSVGQEDPKTEAHTESEGEEQSLADVRSALQQIDEEILRLFAKRQRIARRAGEIKWRRDCPLYDPIQATKHLALLLREGARRGISHEDVRALYQSLHCAALNEQRRVAPPKK